MQKITTHLWYDKEAVEAAEFYCATFPDTKITGRSKLEDTPSGSVDIVELDLMGSHFTLISAGPLFKFNPSVSFHVKCASAKQVDKIWGQLIQGGKALMELGEYDFSKRYGWVSDKYGVSWQLILADNAPTQQRITPVLMFVGDVCGRAEEAVGYYVSVFRNAKAEFKVRYGAGMEPDKPESLKYAHFMLEGVEFGAMDSARPHDFTFNEAISFMVHCEDQAELDYYWEKLSAVPESEQCGWLKDKFGVSWQIVPKAMESMMKEANKAQLANVTQAFLKMKKLDIAELEKAYNKK